MKRIMPGMGTVVKGTMIRTRLKLRERDRHFSDDGGGSDGR